MTEKQIFLKLNEHLKIVQKNYPVENIFGIFVTEVLEDDIHSEAVVIPLLEDVCTSTNSADTILNNNIDVLDIRTIYEATKNHHPETINSLYTEYIIINPRYQHIYQKVLRNNREKIKKSIGEIPHEQLKTGLMKICCQVWLGTCDNVAFLKELTDAEKLALDGVIKLVGDEGVFSQAKAASSVGVSRLTMSNLIMKLKFYNIAEVDYLGNKGTYIKFLDDTILDIKNERV